jgi:hypothetical protein
MDHSRQSRWGIQRRIILLEGSDVPRSARWPRYHRPRRAANHMICRVVGAGVASVTLASRCRVRQVGVSARGRCQRRAERGSPVRPCSDGGAVAGSGGIDVGLGTAVAGSRRLGIRY